MRTTRCILFPTRARERRATCLALALLVTLGALPPSAEAGRERPLRQGWVLGLVLGKGSGDFTVVDGDRVAITGWSGGGKILRGRAGYYLTEELQISAEYGVWRRAAVGDSASTEVAAGTPGWVEPVDRYLGSGLVAVSLYPRLDGFSLRAGFGYGLGLAQGEVEGVLVRREKAGPMLLMGLAYEFGISKDLSIALGADFGRLEAGEELSGNFAHFTATFQVHLPHGLPRRWF